MKYLLVFLGFVSCFSAKADAWDNLTREQAEKVVAHLEAHPFIFDYCDCCSETVYPISINFHRVTSTEIVSCEWNPEMFSVKIQSEFIAVLTFDKDGIDKDQSDQMVGEDGQNQIIYMNYNWVWNPEKKTASPIFDVVYYDYYGENPEPCNPYFNFPSPDDLSNVVIYKKYKKWYKKAMK